MSFTFLHILSEWIVGLMHLCGDRLVKELRKLLLCICKFGDALAVKHCFWPYTASGGPLSHNCLAQLTVQRQGLPLTSKAALQPGSYTTAHQLVVAYVVVQPGLRFRHEARYPYHGKVSVVWQLDAGLRWLDTGIHLTELLQNFRRQALYRRKLHKTEWGNKNKG